MKREELALLIQRIIAASVDVDEHTSLTSEEDWSLTGGQMLFMLQNHNVIEAAFANDDLESLRRMMISDEFKALFGDMGFDEAYDGYRSMLE